MSDNELIAAFMGGVKAHPSHYQYYGDGWGDYVWVDLPNISVTPFLEYDTSWDWLMPVVEKIETLFDIGIFYDGKREPDVHNVRVYAKRGGSETIVVAYGKSKIETTYKAVVEFIKWYNQQPK